MNSIKNLDSVISLLVNAKTIKGTSFVGIDNYENKQGEVSKQLIIAGITFENALLHDFNSLQANKKTIFETLVGKFDKDTVEVAYNEIFVSLEKRLSSDDVKEKLRLENDATIARSDAQINAYIHIAKGVKISKENEQLHVFGLVVRKTVIVPIEYKSVNSSDKTICKRQIEKLANFKQAKYRTFIFDKGTIKMKGIAI